MSSFITFGGYRNRKRLTRDAIDWFMDYMGLGKFVTWIHVIDRRCQGEGYDGCCTNADNLYRPREFEIELDNRMDEKEYLVTLFHELIHVEQRLRQRHQHRVAYLKRGGTVWQGEFYDGDTPYEDQPWEVEAFAKQYTIYEEYAKLRKP